MLTRVFPFLGWFKGYTGESLRADLISGLTVALVLIPQSMAYAQLAGLPPYYGLYASFLPPLVAALFGSSRQLATGPVAVVSLMTSASLAPLATQGSEAYIAYAIMLALMVGLFQLALGVLRLGLVVNFLSHPVVNGFTNAAAIIIATSQLSKLFGVYVDKAEHHYETIIRVIESAMNFTHWPTLVMGVLAFAIMYLLKRYMPKVPNVLVAVALTTTISWGIGFQHDAKAPVTALKAPAASELIAAFNQKVNAIPALGEKRAELGRKLEEAKGMADDNAHLELEYRIKEVGLAMDRLKGGIHNDRAALRDMLFDGVVMADGSMLFYQQGQTPDGMQTDGRVWRLKVGNRPLDVNALPMMGGGAVVGTVPSGLPTLSIPTLDISVMLQLLPYAAIISLLGFMEAISIAKAMAAKTGQRLDPNQELVGQGLANILGAVGKSYPASGSFSRSAVNLASGAVSGLSSVFTSMAVVIVLLFFTPLLYHLPQSVLAAVIMMAVIGLINAQGFRHAWKAQWYDGAISIVSFLCTLAFAPHLDKGIFVGVVLSLGVFLYKSMRPRVANLSRDENLDMRDAEARGLRQCEYMAVVRFDGPLFFANASFLEDQIMERMEAMPRLRHILIVCNGINDIDASGEEALGLLIDRVRSAGIDLSFSGMNEAVTAVLKRTHVWERIGEDHIYATMDAALCEIHEKAHKNGAEDNCPLTTYCALT
ncbi:SulP family inorganic anion transporter [Oleidesulfovibrio alaskensis]|jgi:MFS superfamily sulfate permease-like transporter|uniref:SulP family inorganic anion transporter n=1 Tax=Oleidesulfovibrio alaskensis TaxID=58180 RepID=UPI001A59B82B|nr:SulP family inorganic anion transporter [Oleidesulfovibrio alaskensis]MBG0772697.1 SulP family inorganic anion transporter [Oleidesulfovibrio alaskensis]MBL3581872.1 SulP family inorganic anion transporter [Oleidesulfovibrio alaskensis]